MQQLRGSSLPVAHVAVVCTSILGLTPVTCPHSVTYMLCCHVCLVGMGAAAAGGDGHDSRRRLHGECAARLRMFLVWAAYRAYTHKREQRQTRTNAKLSVYTSPWTGGPVPGSPQHLGTVCSPLPICYPRMAPGLSTNFMCLNGWPCCA